MQEFVCQGTKKIIPTPLNTDATTDIDDRVRHKQKLVLLSCGHFEESECWKEYLEVNRSADPLLCPYDSEHYFPYPIREIEVAHTAQRENVEQWRNKWLANIMVNPSRLVLLNCGHFLAEDCWNIHRRKEPLSCPFDPAHKFPVVVLALQPKRDFSKVWPDLVRQRSDKLNNTGWIESAFHPARPLRSYQISYGQNVIEDNYRDFFGTSYYPGLLALSFATLHRVLEWTVHNQEVDTLRKVLPYVNNIMAPIDKDMTILHLATLVGNPEIVSELLDGTREHFPELHSTLVNETTDLRLNALHYTARGRHYQATRILLDSAADPNQMDGYTGRTPLAYAIERGSLPIVALIVASGMTNLSYVWKIQNGFRKNEVVQLAYPDIVTHYLENIVDSEILEVFQAVVDPGQDQSWHLVDRSATGEILTIEDVLTNSDLCDISSIDKDLLYDLLDTSAETGDSKEDLCQSLENKAYTEIEARIVPVFLKHNINCLLCRQPFTLARDIVTSYQPQRSEAYDLLSCGFVHKVCPDNADPGYVKCDECEGWLIDGASPKLAESFNS